MWYKERPGRIDTDSLIVSRTKESNRGYLDDAGDGRQLASKPITICGDQPAWYRETKRVRPEVEEILESITTSWDGVAYKALYIRLSNDSRDGAAEAAIRSLCKKKST